MFQVNEDNSIYLTRGDILAFSVSAEKEDGTPYVFQAGDVLTMKVYAKKDCTDVVLSKNFAYDDAVEGSSATTFWLFLKGEETKFDNVISKPKDYWYEIVLNEETNPQTIIGYDEDGAKLLKLFPEGADITEPEITDKIIPFVDSELDMTSSRPVENRAIASAFANLRKGYEQLYDAVLKKYVTPNMYGAVGDGEVDDTEAIQAALDSKQKVYFPCGVYKVTKTLVAYNSVEFNKDAKIEFYPRAAGETCLKFSGKLTRIGKDLPCSIEGAAMTVDAEVIAGLKEGDFVYISTNELAAPTAREYDSKRDILQVSAINGDVITFASVPEHNYNTVTIDKMETIDGIIVAGAKIVCKEKYIGTNGIVLEYAKNATVRNCHISNFDEGQIVSSFCVFCDIHSNFCEVDYSESLQYGIIVFSSSNITVYGNKVNSRRTAIDVTRLSNKVTVSGNTVLGGVNTHSATNVNITNNTVNDGMILIRGKNIVVSGNSVQCYDQNCIDIEEMGIEGGHIISNNIFKGYCSMRCYLSNISITGNHFIVSKVMLYNSGTDWFESVIRLMTTNNKTEGAIIAGNTFDAVGISPKYCIESYSNMNVIYNVVIQDNIIRGFKRGIYMPQKSDALGNNLIVKNNLMTVSEYGIVFRFTNNTQIVGNTIIGTEKGVAGILRFSASGVESEGLIIRDNFIKNFVYGFNVEGTADMKKAVYMDNVCQDVDTNSQAVGTNARRIPNDLFIASPNGTVYYLKVDDNGVLTTVNQNYTA